jgi:hypothetical protein
MPINFDASTLYAIFESKNFKTFKILKYVSRIFGRTNAC